jgi:hypothetical protein
VRPSQYASLAFYVFLFLLFVWSTPRVSDTFTGSVLVVATLVLIGSIFWPKRDDGPPHEFGEPLWTDPFTFFLSVPLRAAKGVGVIVGIAAVAMFYTGAAALAFAALAGVLYGVYWLLMTISGG